MDILEKSKEQLDELNEKHWSECQMIANYDNELKEAVKILERLPALHRTILLEAPHAAAVMGGLLQDSALLLARIRSTTHPYPKADVGETVKAITMRTNAAAIRSMTNRQLAEFLNGIEAQGYEAKGNEGANFKGYKEENIKFWEGYLANPADEDYDG